MRARNPWVRARFSLLGWNVRFIGLFPLCRKARFRPRPKESRQEYAGLKFVSTE
jgi:hypothetical protein